MLKWVGMARNEYKSYLTHLNTFLSLAYGHVKTAMYAQERLLIAPVTCKYFIIRSQ